MNTAVVGLGYWGPKLLRNLVALHGADQVIAVDGDLARIEALCREYPALSFAVSLEQALDRFDVGAVVVATPVESHAPLTRMALDAGCHVLVEKPLAGSVAEAVDLVGRAERARRVLMAGHTFLFSPRITFISEYLRSGRLGSIHYVTSSRLNLGLHRHDASVIWDLAPHDFSILFHLLGETPVSVQTAARSILQPRLPEVAFMNLTFPSGAVASVTVSWLAPRKVRNTVIVGDQQMIVYDDTQNDEPVKIYDKGLVVPDSSSFADNQLTYRYGDTIAPHVSATEPLAIQLAHFMECAESGRPCISDGWFGLTVVEALEAAQRSWEEGGRPIETASVRQDVPTLAWNRSE